MLSVATDPETGQTSAEPVTALHLNLDVELADVTVSLPADPDHTSDQMAEGKGGRSIRGPTATIETTADHPFWDATAQEWVGAGELVPGQSTLLTDDGQLVEVVAVRTYLGERWMHNLTVANLHTYYVLAGDTPVLAHNVHEPIGCGPGGAPIYEIPPGSIGGVGAGQRIPPKILAEYNIGVKADPNLPTPLCSYCRTNPATSADHVHPRSMGGDLTDANTTPACTFCNSSKGARGRPVNPPPNYTGPWPPPRLREIMG
jgi:hypothetical protein